MGRATAEMTTWVSVATAARLLNCTPRMVRYYADTGRIRSRRLGPRGWIQVALEDAVTLKNSSPALHPA
jgi:hypothetical protein